MDNQQAILETCDPWDTCGQFDDLNWSSPWSQLVNWSPQSTDPPFNLSDQLTRIVTFETFDPLQNVIKVTLPLQLEYICRER